MAASGGVPEHILVREVLHCCQGVSGGRYIWYQGADTDDLSGRFACGAAAEISNAQRQLISRITELGWLLRRIKQMTSRAMRLRSAVHEALIAATNREVNNCYRLIAILEAQQQQQLGNAHDAAAGTTATASTGELSLRRLEVWLSEPQQRLRTAAACLETALPLRGGQAINALHAMSKHGDPLVRRVVGPLLEEVCVPYFTLVARWVLDGKLECPKDFMITAQDLGPSPSASAIWRSGYTLDSVMKPRFVSDDLAEGILTAGKTVAFLRETCSDTEWAAAMSGTSAVSMDAAGGTYQRLKWLETAVTDIKSTVGTRLLDVIMLREHLPMHLAAVKKFLLLSQGDFVEAVLDAAGAELDRPARELSRYSLQGHVDAALRSCSAAVGDSDGINAETVDRVQVRLSRALEGDRGWDVFNLTYVLEGPAAAVLGPETLSAYASSSRFLWTVKHVDHVLVDAWHDLNAAQHALNDLRSLNQEHGIDLSVMLGEIKPLLRFLHARRSDMARFLAALGTRLVFKVIEPAWDRLNGDLKEVTDLDGAIAAHEEALVTILRGTYCSLAELNTSSTFALPTSALESLRAEGGKELRAALKSILDIAGPVRRVSEAIQTAVVDMRGFLQRVRESEASGIWSEETLLSVPSVPMELLLEVRSAVSRVHSSFDRHLRGFLSQVPSHTHLDLRFSGYDVETMDTSGRR